MTDRQEFSANTKLLARRRCGGMCENCGIQIRPGNGPEYDHIVESFYGGGNDLENCQVLCRNCHGAKTSSRAPEMAKSRRLEKAAAGVRKSKRPMRKPPPGSRYNWERLRYEKT